MTPVILLTGFLGSGKTTLLSRLLRGPDMARTAVLINEFGEVGLDHLLVEHVAESVVLLKSGCVCCTIREDLKATLRDLLGRRDRGEIPAFDRVVIETTGLADPGPVVFTLLGEPVIMHHFSLASVVTTLDAVNGRLHLSQDNPEGVRQLAAADRVVLTKTDLVSPAQAAEMMGLIAAMNPAAWVSLATDAPGSELFDPVDHAPRRRHGGTQAYRSHLGGGDPVTSLSLVREEPLDWGAFGLWLAMLLNRHGDRLLRVKGLLQVEGLDGPVLLNAVQHVVHPPRHLDRWPDEDHRTRIVFIARGLDLERVSRSLAVFSGSIEPAPLR